MVATQNIKFMDKRRLQEEAERYGCEVEHHHHRRKVITLRMGDRWTFLKDPNTGEPIQRLRSITIDSWKEAIRVAAEYLGSEAYRDAI